MGNEYVFVHDSYIYCGFRTVNSEYSKATIEEDQAKETAKEYLEHIVKDSSEYKYEKTTNQDWNYSYAVMFRHYIEEIPTEEVVWVHVGGNGKVDSYSNFLAECFDNTIVDAAKVKKGIEKVKEQLEEEHRYGIYEIEEQCLTYKDGALTLKTSFFYRKSSDSETSVLTDKTVYTPLQ